MSSKNLRGRVFQSLEKGILYLAIVSIALSMLLVCWEVFTRYALGVSTDWIAEASKYLVVCVAMLLAAPMTQTEEHIAFTFIATRLGGRAQQIARLVTILAGLWVSIFVFVYSLKMTLMLKEWGQTTESETFKMWWIYFFMVVSMLLIAIYYFEMLIRWFGSGSEKEQKEA
jgi:TRAP-type C4-dicarboxylate transport system permease small subunit